MDEEPLEVDEWVHQRKQYPQGKEKDAKIAKENDE